MFTAHGDEHCQRILLLFECGEGLNMGQIAVVSPLSRLVVSHHFKVLRDANVLLNEKIGKEIYFWINRSFVEEVLSNVLDYDAPPRCPPGDRATTCYAECIKNAASNA